MLPRHIHGNTESGPKKVGATVKNILASFLVLLGIGVILLQTFPIVSSWLWGGINSFYDKAVYSLPVSSNFLKALAKPVYFDPGAAYMSVLAASSNQTGNLNKIKIDKKYKKLMYIDVPKAGINHIPVFPNIAGDKPEEYKRALSKGVAHLQGTPLPGDGGISIIYGHSGIKKFLSRKLPDYLAFTLLEKVDLGDSILIKRDGKTLKYVVTARKIVKPYELDFLGKLDARIERLALVTCWPVGLGSSRLVIIAQYYE